MTNLYLGYDPRADLFKKKKPGGGYSWYIKYYLPNGNRVRRPCGPTRTESLKRLRLKVAELLEGVFDEKDLGKMPLERFEPVRRRLTIEEGMNLYLEMTRNNRRPATQQADSAKIKSEFKTFTEQGFVFLDEVRHTDAQRWVNSLEDRGLREATVKAYTVLMAKVYNYLTGTAELLEVKNPFRTLSISRKGTMVRDYLPEDSEVRALLEARLPPKSGHTVPIVDIVKFAVFTGARKSEILHAEWDDFDLEAGIWRIRSKPECPTAEGLGWQPKWGKSRNVPLFDEALEVLRRRLEARPLVTEGWTLLRDKEGVVIGKETGEAQFVFCRTGRRKKNSPELVSRRVDHLRSAFGKLLGIAGVRGLQFKDLRTYLNHLLVSRYGFSNKEASSYLGNSPEVNRQHYDPVSLAVIQAKTEGLSPSQLIGLSEPVYLN